MPKLNDKVRFEVYNENGDEHIVKVEEEDEMMEEKKVISIKKHQEILKEVKEKAFREIQKVKLNPDYKSSLERKWVIPTHEKINRLMCVRCKGSARLILYQLIEGIRNERKDWMYQIQLQKNRNKLKNEILSNLLFYCFDFYYKESRLEEDYDKIKELIKNAPKKED